MVNGPFYSPVSFHLQSVEAFVLTGLLFSSLQANCIGQPKQITQTSRMMPLDRTRNAVKYTWRLKIGSIKHCYAFELIVKRPEGVSIDVRLSSISIESTQCHRMRCTEWPFTDRVQHISADWQSGWKPQNHKAFYIIATSKTAFIINDPNESAWTYTIYTKTLHQIEWQGELKELRASSSATTWQYIYIEIDFTV